MIGDVVEYGQWKTHMRQESFIFACSSVGVKLGMGGAQALITAIMSACGYITSTGNTVVQPESAIEAIKNIYIFSLIIVWVLVIIVTKLYKLDKKYPEIMAELHDREAHGKL